MTVTLALRPSHRSGLRLVDIHKSFPGSHVLKGINFDVADGEILAVLGPSGCGKSTLLMTIAGLETPDRGDVIWDTQKINAVPPHRRGFGLMFQDYVLFPHMNVHKNVAFGLEMSGLAENEVNHRVRESLELVGLHGFEDRDVNLLSGGEQQRVALARALAPQPDLLMLDEPLGSIDRTLRDRLIEDLHRILHEMKQTAIYVTHDQEEAFTIADRVVLMRAGEVEQIGTPQEIYRNPATLFAARFLGFSNILSGSTFSRDSHSYLDTSIGEFPVDPGTVGNVTILLKPDSIRLDGKGEMSLSGIITRKTFRGDLCQVDILIRNEVLTFNFLSNISLPEVGEPVIASFDPKEALILFNDEEIS